MIKVTIGTTTTRKTDLYAKETTVREVLEQNNVDYRSARITANGDMLVNSEFDCTLAEVAGDSDALYLIAVVKMDSGISI